MKVLGIFGSPRRQGNSDLLMQAFLQGAAAAGARVEEIFLREMKISPCLEIYHCFKDGTCPIKDDMRGLYDQLVEADVVALASPVFFYSLSAQAKAMIDRTQALWARRYVLKDDFPGGNRQGVLLSPAPPRGACCSWAPAWWPSISSTPSMSGMPRRSWYGGWMKKGPSMTGRRSWNRPGSWAAGWPRER